MLRREIKGESLRDRDKSAGVNARPLSFACGMVTAFLCIISTVVSLVTSILSRNRCFGNGVTMYVLFLFMCCGRIREDMGITEDSKGKLLTDMEDLTPSLLNLTITGRAVSHIHNGDMLYDAKGNLLVCFLSHPISMAMGRRGGLGLIKCLG